MKYISKSVEINAIQFLGSNINDVIKFTGVKNIELQFKEGRWSCIINTSLVRLVVLETDYIIKAETNELSIVKADIFEKSYESKK